MSVLSIGVSLLLLWALHTWVAHQFGAAEICCHRNVAVMLGLIGGVRKLEQAIVVNGCSLAQDRYVDVNNSEGKSK
jgi:hypothetical protein